MSRRLPLTPGAQRCLDRSARIAQAEKSTDVSTRHILRGLFLEEGCAAVVLKAAGLEQFGVACQRSADSVGKLPAIAELPELDNTEWATELIQQARQVASQYDPYSGEVTSEHLLVALACLDEPTMAQLGLECAQLARQLFPPALTHGEILEVAPEFRLADSGVVPGERPGVASGSASPQRQLPEPRFRQLRMIDAAANRAREGLRVVEDYCRFVLDDRLLTAELKSMRHALAARLAAIPAADLLQARDTAGDTGTNLTTSREHVRQSAAEIVLANMKRAQEGLRSLEEMLKLMPDADSREVEQLRYRSYSAEKAVMTTLTANAELHRRVLCLLLTESLCRHDWRDVATAALRGGVGIIQLREKSLPDHEIVARGLWLRAVTRDSGALLIVNDRPDLADQIGADGVHLGQTDGDLQAAREVLGPGRLVGISTHDPRQAAAAVMAGADYLGVGPCFATSTKQFSQLAGISYVRHVAAATSLPWFAIGGIDGSTAPEVFAAGATRIAVSSAICGAEQPAEVAWRLSQLAGAAASDKRVT